jgi:hypothetical protein
VAVGKGVIGPNEGGVVVGGLASGGMMVVVGELVAGVLGGGVKRAPPGDRVGYTVVVG